jgi:hypothetical protein
MSILNIVSYGPQDRFLTGSPSLLDREKRAAGYYEAQKIFIADLKKMRPKFDRDIIKNVISSLVGYDCGDIILSYIPKQTKIYRIKFKKWEIVYEYEEVNEKDYHRKYPWNIANHIYSNEIVHRDVSFWARVYRRYAGFTSETSNNIHSSSAAYSFSGAAAA